jgi:hypothetical protein
MDKWQAFIKFEDGWLKARIGRRKNTGKPLSADNIEYITYPSIYIDALRAMAERLNDSGIITADAAREAVRRYKRSMGVRSVRVCE